jgi:hypothetical protein
MKKKTSILCAILLASFIFNLAGCGFSPQHKFERIQQLEMPMQPAGSFSAETHNGAIKVLGTDEAMCNVTAKIVVRAHSPEEAQLLAEKVDVTLVQTGSRIATHIDKPRTSNGESISVGLDISVPHDTALDLNTHNGAVGISDILANAKAVTHNGAITLESATGNSFLETHNGRIDCREIAGDLNAKTHNGGVKVVYSQAASGVVRAEAITYNGGISFTAPAGLSAMTEISTHNGSIRTDMPITIAGEIGKRHIKGTIGNGEGKLYLKTHNGSIQLK